MRATIATSCLAAVLLCACEEAPQQAPPKPATSSAATAATAASPTKPAASASAAATASAAPAAVSCDVTITPGESIGDKKLSGTTSVKVDVDETKSYCVFGLKLTKKSTLAEVKPAAPKSCTEAALIGATHLNCDDEGVALTFAGPPGILSQVTIYPKGIPAPTNSAKPGTKK